MYIIGTRRVFVAAQILITIWVLSALWTITDSDTQTGHLSLVIYLTIKERLKPETFSKSLGKPIREERRLNSGVRRDGVAMKQ